jgi:hypothetical protein
MSFVSFWFPFFLVLVLVGLAIMPSRESRHGFLLVASLAFYAFGSPAFVLVLLVPAIVDYACAIRMEESTDAATRRRWLMLSLVVNLGVLAYFKYADFLVDSIGALLGIATAPLAVMLPIGISFFTFKTMSYTIDVYRGQLPACRSLRDYTMFVSFFPELVARPHRPGVGVSSPDGPPPAMVLAAAGRRHAAHPRRIHQEAAGRRPAGGIRRSGLPASGAVLPRNDRHGGDRIFVADLL